MGKYNALPTLLQSAFWHPVVSVKGWTCGRLNKCEPSTESSTQSERNDGVKTSARQQNSMQKFKQKKLSNRDPMNRRTNPAMCKH